MKTLIGIVVAILIIIIGFIAFSFLMPQTAQAPNDDGNSTTTVPASDENVSVESPAPNAVIASPVTITGSALGTYYFEASFPIEIRDQNGNIVGQGHAEAQGDWMTEAPVPFKATVTFTSPGAGQSGTIRLKNDNPSGDPSRDKFFDLPVKF
jgi:hypothetical protein